MSKQNRLGEELDELFLQIESDIVLRQNFIKNLRAEMGVASTGGEFHQLVLRFLTDNSCSLKNSNKKLQKQILRTIRQCQ